MHLRPLSVERADGRRLDILFDQGLLPGKPGKLVPRRHPPARRHPGPRAQQSRDCRKGMPFPRAPCPAEAQSADMKGSMRGKVPLTMASACPAQPRFGSLCANFPLCKPRKPHRLRGHSFARSALRLCWQKGAMSRLRNGPVWRCLPPTQPVLDPLRSAAEPLSNIAQTVDRPRPKQGTVPHGKRVSPLFQKRVPRAHVSSRAG